MLSRQLPLQTLLLTLMLLPGALAPLPASAAQSKAGEKQAGVTQAEKLQPVEQTWTVNFKDSDIQEVIKFVADVSGKTLVIDPRVKGRVKVISAAPLNQEQLYNLFLSVLEIHGFSAVAVGDVVRVIPSKEVRSTPVPVLDSGAASGDVQVTQIIELQNIAAAKVLPVIRPLVPSHAHMAAYAPSNAIIISDTAANIARVRDIINRIDTTAIDATELVVLNHATADDVVTMVKQVVRSEAATSGEEQMVMVADKRTNGILISGDDVQRQRVRQLIERLDQAQPQSGNVRVIYLRYARAEQVAKVLTRVLDNMQKLDANKQSGVAARATVEADEDTNSLLVTADPESLQSIKMVIERLDIRRAQILVEAIIVEMTDTSGENLGIEWLFRDINNGFGSSVSTGATGVIVEGAVAEADGESGGVVGALSSIAGQTLGLGKSVSRGDFLLLLTALQQDTGANILSTPNLLTLDNHAATISVGQNVPFVTGSYTSTGTGVSDPFQTIERQNVGIVLEVTPQVNEGDGVVLDIVQEVSSLSGATGISASDVITNERKISTRIMAEDGAIVVLGGLIKDDVQTFEQRVPVLGSVPWLGRLFRSNSNTVTKTNLMVFIRATVIRENEALTGATAEKYRLIREKQLANSYLGGLVEDKKLTDSVLPEWPGAVVQLPPRAPAAAGSAVGAQQ